MSNNLEKGESRSRTSTSSEAQTYLPLGTAPNDNAAGSIDEITTLLSRSHIQPPPQADPSIPLSEAARLIHEHLPIELESARTDGLLTPDHECFAGARRFCDRRGISSQALGNFLGLACGNLRFPTILLQNPAKFHDNPCLGQMILLTPTLSWLEGLLGETGLNMADVMILDVCPLLSAEDLNLMGPTGKETAIEEAYSVTEDILAVIKPKIMISCQCQTKGSRNWPIAANHVASNLCSSVSGAQEGHVEVVTVGDHDIHVIQGFHPMHLLRQKDHFEYITKETILKGLFRMVYTPCATWQREVEMLVSIEAMLRSFISVLRYFQETVESVQTAMENMIDQGNFSKGSLPRWDNVEDRFVAFNDTRRTFQGKLKRMSTEERKKIATRLGWFWPAPKAFAAVLQSE